MKNKAVTVTLNPAVDKTVEVESFNIGGLNRITALRADPGGKGINVAKVLHGFGVSVTAAGFIAGLQGAFLTDALDKIGMQHDFIKVTGETRTNLKVLDQATNTVTEFNEPGFTVEEKDIDAFIEKLKTLLNGAGVLSLSGSLPRGANRDIYARLIALANTSGVKTILDADGTALANGIKAKPYAIKPNIFELEQLLGQSLRIDTAKPDIPKLITAAKTLQGGAISLIAVSMGADGAVFVNKDEAIITKPFKIAPQSTVGAGDAMVGAISYALLNNLTLRETAVLATSAGTITASKPGTEVCSLEEAMDSADKVEVTIYSAF